MDVQITYPFNWPYDAYHHVGNTGAGRTYKYVSVTSGTTTGRVDAYNYVQAILFGSRVNALTQRSLNNIAWRPIFFA